MSSATTSFHPKCGIRLAIRGAAGRVIEHLAGHSSLVTTQRYMHLSPGVTKVALLEARHRGGLEPITASARRLETGWETAGNRSPTIV